MDAAEVLELRGSAADRVYEYVKAGVLARRFDAQDLLTEGQIAEAVGVSRTPVREGLLRLQAEGMLRLLPKRGALVLPVTAAEMADVLEARRLVESYAARKAASHADTRGLRDALAEHLDAMRAAMKARDASAYVRADRAFHAEIVALTGNEIIISLYRSLRDRQLRMGVVNLLDDGGRAVDLARMRSTLAEHEAIVHAIAARSLRAVDHAVTEHLDHAERTLTRR